MRSLQDGLVLDALTLFKRNVSLHFAGVTECAICYSIISVNDRSLPNRSCKTCDNTFHASCLYKVRSFLLSILPSSIESYDERALSSDLAVVQHESQLVLPSVQKSVLDHERPPLSLEDIQPPSPFSHTKACSAEQREESLRPVLECTLSLSFAFPSPCLRERQCQSCSELLREGASSQSIWLPCLPPRSLVGETGQEADDSFAHQQTHFVPIMNRASHSRAWRHCTPNRAAHQNRIQPPDCNKWCSHPPIQLRSQQKSPNCKSIIMKPPTPSFLFSAPFSTSKARPCLPPRAPRSSSDHEVMKAIHPRSSRLALLACNQADLRAPSLVWLTFDPPTLNKQRRDGNLARFSLQRPALFASCALSTCIRLDPARRLFCVATGSSSALRLDRWAREGTSAF